LGAISDFEGCAGGTNRSFGSGEIEFGLKKFTAFILDYSGELLGESGEAERV
jgi:hypothetical protein